MAVLPGPCTSLLILAIFLVEEGARSSSGQSEHGGQGEKRGREFEAHFFFFKPNAEFCFHFCELEAGCLSKSQSTGHIEPGASQPKGLGP